MVNTGMFDLTGRIALVTAGGRGLGREFCEAMAEFGADVACNDIDMASALETVDLIKKFGRRAIAIEGDVSQQDQVERMVAQTVAEFGVIDILFCNAGIGLQVRLHEIAIKDWERVMAVNVTGTFLCMRAVLPIMLKQKRGSIIITSSVAGIRAGSEEWSVPNLSVYGTSKHAVIGLTRHAAVAYAKDGIRINAIAPGSHATYPLSMGGEEEGKKRHEKLFKFIPMGRPGMPSEIKGLAVYLASDASSYVTGQVFVQDGGMFV